MMDSSDQVVFENVVIRDCLGPAVRIANVVNEIEIDPFAEQDKSFKPPKLENLQITFKFVQFLNNTDFEDSYSYYESLDGGAIQIAEATEALVEDCHFEGNTAFLGGAINIESGSLKVNRSRFIENEAQISGGAISGSFNAIEKKSKTRFIVEDTMFLRNRDVSGGEDASGLTLTNGAPLETSEFLSFPSPQSSGGAIYIQGFSEVSVSGCIFDGNKANPAAGAIFVADNDFVDLTNNTFRNNVAEYTGPRRIFDLEQGGAIYVAFTRAESKIRLSKCIFENNTATYGGGLHMVMMLVTNAYIEECEFLRNSAHLGGGGLVLRNTIEVSLQSTGFLRQNIFRLRFWIRSLFKIELRRVAVHCSRMEQAPGLFKGQMRPEIPFSKKISRSMEELDSSLEQVNHSIKNAVRYVFFAGQVATQKLGFIRNKAQRNGGGLCLVESLASGSIGLQQSLFEGNTARRGGGLFADSIASLILRAPVETTHTLFVGNKAMAGGAVYLRPSSQVKNVIAASLLNCTGNEAVRRLEDIYSEPLNYADIDVIQSEGYSLGRTLLNECVFNCFEGRRKLMQFQDKADGSDVLLRTTGEDPCSPGGGGAICLVLSEVPERASVKVEIMNSYMLSNVAASGGNTEAP